MNYRTAPITYGNTKCRKKLRKFEYRLVGVSITSITYVTQYPELECRECTTGECYIDSALRTLSTKHIKVVPAGYNRNITAQEFDALLKNYIKNRHLYE